MWFQNSRDGRKGGHLRYQSGMILAIMNIYGVPTLPISSNGSDLISREEEFCRSR